MTSRLYTFRSATNTKASALYILSNTAINNISINSHSSTYKQLPRSQKELKISTITREKSRKNSQRRHGFCFLIPIKGSNVPDTKDRVKVKEATLNSWHKYAHWKLLTENST